MEVRRVNSGLLTTHRRCCSRCPLHLSRLFAHQLCVQVQQLGRGEVKLGPSCNHLPRQLHDLPHSTHQRTPCNYGHRHGVYTYVGEPRSKKCRKTQGWVHECECTAPTCRAACVPVVQWPSAPGRHPPEMRSSCICDGETYTRHKQRIKRRITPHTQGAV